MIMRFCIFIFTIFISMASMATEDHSITVFVHGTFPIRRILNNPLSPFRRLVYCPEGLSLAKNLPNHYHYHDVAKNCVDKNSNHFSLDHFYTFGWKSECVYDFVRNDAAKKLVEELNVVVKKYQSQYNIVPKVRLIGFSHGGNVLLNTANHLPISINSEKVLFELWLLGTPVQVINSHLVNSENFSKVYSLYSTSDWIQRMDPQGLRNKEAKDCLWSDRTFKKDSQCLQIQLTVDGYPIGHSRYRTILKHFPQIKQLVEDQSENENNGVIAVNLSLTS